MTKVVRGINHLACFWTASLLLNHPMNHLERHYNLSHHHFMAGLVSVAAFNLAGEIVSSITYSVYSNHYVIKFRNGIIALEFAAVALFAPAKSIVGLIGAGIIPGGSLLSGVAMKGYALYSLYSSNSSTSANTETNYVRVGSIGDGSVGVGCCSNVVCCPIVIHP